MRDIDIENESETEISVIRKILTFVKSYQEDMLSVYLLKVFHGFITSIFNHTEIYLKTCYFVEKYTRSTIELNRN